MATKEDDRDTLRSFVSEKSPRQKKGRNEFENPTIKAYPCGDLYISKAAIQKWNLYHFGGVDILIDRSTAVVRILFKQVYDPTADPSSQAGQYKLEREKRGGNSMSVGLKSKLKKLRKQPPSEAIEVDAHFITDNNMLVVDLVELPRS